MAKTREELNALKEEVETLNEKLAELTDEELAQVTGGSDKPHPGMVMSMFADGRSMEEKLLPEM